MQLYLPAPQSQPPYSRVLVKAASDPLELIPLVEREVLAIDPHQPIADVGTLGELTASWVAVERVTATLLSIFAVLAMALAGVGIVSMLPVPGLRYALFAIIALASVYGLYRRWLATAGTAA